MDADKLAHQVMEYGQPAYTEIVKMFGAGILSPDGIIDRKRLGDIVFRDHDKRKALECIVHTYVIRQYRQLTAEAQNQTEYAFIIWDAPLLAEAGLHKECGLVLLVTAGFELKLSRILIRDGITNEQANLRLLSQPSDDVLYKTLIADIGKDRVKIIENNGDLEDLEIKTRMAVSGCQVI